MNAGVRVSDLLYPNLVLADVGTGRKEEILDAISERLARQHPGVDRYRLTVAFLKREGLMSTALADGIAIPHARVPDLPCMIAALARSRAGVDWGSHDGLPTHLFLALAVPDDYPGSHLKILAAASRLLHDAECRRRMMEAPDGATLLHVLRSNEVRFFGSTPPVHGVRPLQSDAIRTI
jgi:PTS system nitrogen regulatory IIA component